MQELTVGILAKLTKDGAKDINVLVHSQYLGRPSPYLVIEDWVYRGHVGGPVESLEQGLQGVVNEHPGYMVQQRITIAMQNAE